MEGIDLWLLTTAWDREYWKEVAKKAKLLDTDGCSGVPDWFGWTCHEHDIHYRTHKTIANVKITKEESDYTLKVRCHQSKSLLKKRSKVLPQWAIPYLIKPIAWVVGWGRWIGLTYIFKRQSSNAWIAMVPVDTIRRMET